MIRKHLSCAGSVVTAFATLLVACSQLSGEGGGADLRDDDAPVVPPTTTTGGGGAGGAPTYPGGPYGVAVGQTIPNYEFVGYPNGEDKSLGMTAITLADFYNPTGDGVYPEDSRYGDGAPKPRGLLINVSATWCQPCNAEAYKVLPVEYAELAPKGAQFLLDLVDGPTPGVAATQKNLDAWTNKYEVLFAAVIDPQAQLTAVFDADAFPGNMIIDTRTMRIVKIVAGVPDASFWPVLANTIAK